MDFEQYISQLQLQPHPEGGYYRETYRSPAIIPCPAGFDGPRNCSTAIYYLLPENQFSAFHRIKSDECWHFYAGGTLLIHILERGGAYTCIRLGADLSAGDVFQYVVPANAWFASEPAPGTQYSLVGCTVSPGFDFRDFEMADRSILNAFFPGNATVIDRLTR
ncbi:cupin domain-containing protein [Segetibacter sp. 3557_3]|uniref:cupin domain-containing protein n=1 Tax=Segetibacter sp. 3557_3 TaxID=2547429 RepID=UPI001058B689|nr:cupin domain-containing protein [Segetibacter sp. 3557_3]TDH29199.1 cupin domain-containing protein [Segetibacter sp. 3557_3]